MIFDLVIFSSHIIYSSLLCICRMILTECSLKHCPCGDKCSNMHFQKHDWVQNLKKFRTKERGYGVLTTVALKMHQFIIEYCGEVISEKQYWSEFFGNAFCLFVCLSVIS